MKSKLIAVLNSAKTNKHEYNVRQHPSLYKWVLAETSFLASDVKFLERLYCVLNDTKPTCPNQKFTQNLNKGYAFCGNPVKCQCAADNHSIKISSSKRSMTASAVTAANEKRKQSCLAKYGTEYNSQSQDIKDKKKSTCMEKYGVVTNLQHNDTQEKIKQTCLTKFGVAYPNQAAVVLSKRAETNIKKYGNICSLQSLQIKEQINVKHQAQSPSQTRYSNDLKNILFTKAKFVDYVRDKTLPTIAHELGIDKKTIARYIAQYECGDILAHSNNSKWEALISDFLEELGIAYEQNTRKVIPPLELDFYLPHYNVAIELNGNYWHSEIAGDKHKNYHYNKWLACREQGIDLYSYFEDELIDNIDVIKNKLQYLVNQNTCVIGARKCMIGPVNANVESHFLNTHHIQGSSKARNKTIGAYYNDRLVAVLSWNLRKQYLEITRYACDTNASYPGLFSKMMKHMISELNYTGQVVSFSNNGHSNGGMYKASGFTLDKILGPSYWYTNNYILRQNRQGYMKSKIAKKFGVDMSDKTEWQAMQELGYDRIWDSGKIKWMLIIT
jgi:G:T-mismatch repair DNA endonuclease (very short patch repair protein)